MLEQQRDAQQRDGEDQDPSEGSEFAGQIVFVAVVVIHAVTLACAVPPS